MLMFFSQMIDHSIEDEKMKRKKQKPIKPSFYASGSEGGRLVKNIFIINGKFQPGFAWKFHFGE